MKNYKVMTSFEWKKKLLIIKIFLIISIIANSQQIDLKDTLKIGVYVNNIYDIDYKKGSYKISLFIWSNSNKEIYDLDK